MIRRDTTIGWDRGERHPYTWHSLRDWRRGTRQGWSLVGMRPPAGTLHNATRSSGAQDGPRAGSRACDREACRT